METRFRIGIFSSTHGIRGEIKVFPTTDDPARFTHLKEVILETKAGEMVLEAEKARFSKGMVILKFKGIDNINDIERYKGASLFVTRENAAPLEEGSYYIADLVGLKVVTDDSRFLGTLQQVMQTGANDVFVVRDQEKKDAKEYHLMDGLEEL